MKLSNKGREILVKHMETAMYKNKMYVMDADCLRNGSLFLSFRGKSKHKNEKMNQLQAFVANARPERTQTRCKQRRRRRTDTHSCSS